MNPQKVNQIRKQLMQVFETVRLHPRTEDEKLIFASNEEYQDAQELATEVEAIKPILQRICLLTKDIIDGEIVVVEPQNDVV